MHFGENFYFHHIPRTGGTSIVNALYDSGSLPYKDIDLLPSAHSTLEPDVDEYTFTIVRNPFDRLVSCYYHNVYGKRNYNNSYVLFFDITFEEWFEYVFYGFKDKIISKQPIKLPNYIQRVPKRYEIDNSLESLKFGVEPQVLYLGLSLRDNNYMLPIGDFRDVLKNVDVFPFETLDQSWCKIAENIGIEISQIKHINKSERKLKNYKHYFSQDLRNETEKNYSLDFAMFDYDW